jgi:replicative DNA helicase
MTATSTRPQRRNDTQPAPESISRALPHNIEAEQAVIGALMLSKDVIGDVATALGETGSGFYTPIHQKIYIAAITLYKAGQPVDHVSLDAAMSNSPDASMYRNAGGVLYLHKCVAACPMVANATYYANIVMESAVERGLIEAGIRIQNLGYGGDGRDLAERVDIASQAVHDIASREARGGFLRFEQLLQATFDEIETVSQLDGKLRGISTGFTDLDLMTSGLTPGQVVVVAARPGMGKSILSCQVAANAAIKLNVPSAIFALEMSHVEITTRILSAEARVPLHVLTSGRLSDDDWIKISRRMGEISKAPLHIDDTVGITLTEIAAKARRMVQQHGIRLFVLDQISLVATPGSFENRQVAIATLSRGLKVLAKQLNVVFIVVAQLNRNNETRTDKRPQLSDLRESGAIEADADIVILIHRDDYYDKESPRAGEADFIVAKHRNGPTDTITVHAQLHLGRFVDMAIPGPN